MNRKELDAELEYHNLLDALTAAKKSGDRDRLAKAKWAVFAHRQARRATTATGAGVATPATLKTSVKGN